MVLTKQTYNNHDKYKNLNKKLQKLNLAKPTQPWFSRLLRHPARKWIRPILTKKTTAPGARTGRLSGTYTYLWTCRCQWCVNTGFSLHPRHWLSTCISLHPRHWLSTCISSAVDRTFMAIFTARVNDTGVCLHCTTFTDSSVRSRHTITIIVSHYILIG